MIGNDVIDLATARAESNWKRRGFLQKLFTQKEQSLIRNASDPELMVWNLWSRKEAAYKIYNRQTRIREFIPLQLECTFEDIREGKVRVKGEVYFTTTSIVGDEIHTIAVAQKSDFSNVIALDKSSEILKKDVIPFLKDSEMPVSISHHGRFENMVALQNHNPNLDLSFKNNSAIV